MAIDAAEGVPFTKAEVILFDALLKGLGDVTIADASTRPYAPVVGFSTLTAVSRRGIRITLVKRDDVTSLTDKYKFLISDVRNGE